MLGSWAKALTTSNSDAVAKIIVSKMLISPPRNRSSILTRFHPFNTARKVPAHVFRAVMMNPAMARQHPFEIKLAQFCHRPRLLDPRIPAGAAERSQRFPVRRPGQVIAAEKKLLPIKQHHVSSGVAGDRQRNQILIELK